MRALISVSPDAYADFLARLDAPPRPNERLQRGMRTPTPWEKCEGNATVGYYALASSAMSVKAAPIKLNFSFISTGYSQSCFPSD
jgi:hypothetical protein